MILSLFILIYTAGYFIPEDMPVLYGVSCELLIVLLCLSSFLKTPYKKHKEKAGWACLTFWTICNIIVFTWFGDFSLINYPLFLIETVLFISIMFYSQFRSYEMRSDKYDKESAFLVFKKPKSLFDFLHCCVFRPVSSVSVVSKGIWYGYTLGQPYHCDYYKENDDNWLIKINVPHHFVVDKLEVLIGAKWSPFNNCCHAIQRIFPLTKFKIADSLPCRMLETIIEKEGENEREQS